MLAADAGVSRDGGAQGPGLGSEEYPGFPADACPEEMPDLSKHHSVMADVLKREPGLYEQLRGRRTALGVGLAKCVKTGMDNRGHPMIKSLGAVAGDAECYETFAPLFDALVRGCHGGDCLAAFPCPAGLPPLATTGARLGLTPLQPDPTGKCVLSTQVRAARSLRGVRFPPAASVEERREVERVLVRALMELEGPLKGRYLPLAASNSCAMRPGGMSPEEERELAEAGLLPAPPDSAAALCSGVGRDWPDARGVFVSDARGFSAWVNEQEHLRVVTMHQGAQIQAAFEELAAALDGVAASLRRHGDGPDGFARSDRLGFLTACPSNLGTALRVSVILRLPLLMREKDGSLLSEWCAAERLSVRATLGQDGLALPGVLEVSNRDRLGISEADTVNLLVEAVAELVRAEQRLEQGGPPVLSPLQRAPTPNSCDEANWEVAGCTLGALFARVVAGGGEEEAAVVQPAPAQPRGAVTFAAGAPQDRDTLTGWWRVLFGASLATSLLVAAAAAALSFGRHGDAAGGVARIEGGTAFASLQKQAKTGCRNWRSVALGEATIHSSVDSCHATCDEQDGCAGFSYQSSACDSEPDSAYSISLGACMLWSGDCHYSDNPCWDLYNFKDRGLTDLGHSAHSSWQLDGDQIGCDNWKSAKIGSQIHVESEDECGLRCQETKGCLSFNFKDVYGGEMYCEGTRKHTMYAVKGSCFLYSESCQKGENKCWDLYTMSSPLTPGYYADVTCPTSQEPEAANYLDPEDDRAAPACCTFDGRTCATPVACAVTQWTWPQASAYCALQGRRLCTVGELLSGTCCSTGCGTVLWTSSARAAATATLATATLAPAPTAAPALMDDPGNSDPGNSDPGAAGAPTPAPPIMGEVAEEIRDGVQEFLANQTR